MPKNSLDISTPSEREIRILRSFDAPRELVFEAFTTPALLRRWMFGPSDWSFEVCDIDLRVGGGYRYVWVRRKDGSRMGASGTYREIVTPARIVATERFDDPWYPGECLLGIEFVERAPGVTTLTQTLLYESRDARDRVLRSPMDEGLSAGFDSLAAIVVAEARARNRVSGATSEPGER